MARFFRRIHRVSLFIILTLYYSFLILFFQKENKTYWCKKWGEKLAKLLKVEIDFKGKESKKGRFFVFNHLSYFDIPLLWTRLDGVYVAKKEVRSWPVIGFAANRIGVIFIDRSNKSDIKRVNSLIDKTLKEGKNIFVFAEGTSSNGDAIKPFKAPLLDVAVKKGDAVRYGIIGYKTPKTELNASDSVCWWGDAGFISHLFKLCALPKFKATIRLGEDELFDEDRKALAQKLWQKSSDLYKKEVLDKR